MRFLLLGFIILTQCAWGPYSGWQQNPAIPGSVATTGFTLDSSQVGTVIVFNNTAGTAVNNTTFTLPVAVIGMQYTFISDISKWITIAPALTDIINFTGSSTGKKISNSGSSNAGDSITLVCQTAGQWSIQSKFGTWALQA